MVSELLEKLTNGFGAGGTNAGDAFGAGLTDSDYTSAFGQLTKDGEGATKKVKTAFEKFKDWLDEEKILWSNRYHRRNQGMGGTIKTLREGY